jgi:pantoate--beta-alanine ligase
MKDLQQCAVIAKMVQDLDLPVRLRFCDIVRESNGLAMSSRNVYLSESGRQTGSRIFACLSECAESLRNGCAVDSSITTARSRLAADGFDVEYLALVDPTNMAEIDSVSNPARLIVAAKLENIRLIDNVAVFDNSYPYLPAQEQ